MTQTINEPTSADIGTTVQVSEDGETWYEASLLGVLPTAFKRRFVTPDIDPRGAESCGDVSLYPKARIIEK